MHELTRLMADQREGADRVAEEIVGSLRSLASRVECAERGSICYAVRSRSLKLQSIVLNRRSLRRLISSADGAVKIDYLKRDLLRTAMHRAEFRYPRRIWQRQ